MSGRYVVGVGLLGLLGALAVTSCHSASGAGSPATLAISESRAVDTTFDKAVDTLARTALGGIKVCADSLGGTRNESEPEAQCMPCIPDGIVTRDDLVNHARRLWSHMGMTPYGASRGPSCVRRAYQLARERAPDDVSLRFEASAFATMSINSWTREQGMRTIDGIVDSMLRAGDTLTAARGIGTLGLWMYERAQRMDARELTIPTDKAEELVHDLLPQPVRFRHLPQVPGRSKELGGSEAAWASQLFASAARLAASSPALRTRYARLSLAPLVMQQHWAAVDSAANALLAAGGADSVAPAALALARYKRVLNGPNEHPEAMRLFDYALRRMPRADSARHDALDLVLTQDDDEWRHSFGAEDRGTLDRRAWTVMDPLWLTPVNEFRIERRARVAEADIRYADVAMEGEAGSETPAGVMLVKRGPPARRWIMLRRDSTRTFGGESFRWKRLLTRGWQTMKSWNTMPDDVPWTVFYSDRYSATGEATRLSPPTIWCPSKVWTSMLECARGSNAAFDKVPFFNTLDTIDVNLARFRATGDSVDMYVGSRLPLRRFRTRDSRNGSRDSIEYGVWIANASGDVAFHKRTSIRLPRYTDVAATEQWNARVPKERMMHRVEAMERRGVTGARGSRRLTSADESFFQLNGFGVSDVIIADTIGASVIARSWRNLVIKPNGGVVEPAKRFAMAWEIYGLKAGPDGRARWRTTIKREDGRAMTNDDIRGLIVAAPHAVDRVEAIEQDASTITYSRSVPADSVIVDYLLMPLPELAQGRHVLVLTVHDLIADVKTTRSVSIRVLQPTAQRRAEAPPSPGAGFAPPIPPPPPIIKPPPMR